MTTSGTYVYNPSLGEIVLYALNLCQIRSPSIVQEHMVSARQAANLLLADWSNETPNLWKVDLVTTTLVQGQATYPVDGKTVMILDAYVTIDNGTAPPIDRIITPVSRSEYATYPNKEQQGFTTVYWFDRLISPTITLWPVPDGYSAQFLKYYRVTQVEDANFVSGQTVDIPYRWLNAFADGMALNLARLWAPSLIPAIQPFADKSYARAYAQDTENVSFYISPQLSGYYRN
jgi:hypothetical protein